MTHRAEQIQDAIVALMPTTSSNFKHRVLSLSQPEGDVPARSVRFGEDVPIDDDGASNFAFLDSLLAIEIDHKVLEVDEETALSALMEMRRETHIALMADRSLGLSFVIDTRYGGASAPARDITELCAGVLTSRWFVHYRMTITDPA